MENKSTVGEQSNRQAFLPFPPFGRDVMLLILAWVAGNVDAISYLGLGHVFTANMTGNTVLLGLALGQREGLAILRALTALGGFVVGLAVGAVIVDRDRRREDWPPVVTGAIMLEGGVLAVFAVIWYLGGIARGRELVYILIALSAMAMGLQSVAIGHLGVAGVVTTYITGTWTSFVAGLIGRLRPANVPSSPPRAGENVVVPGSPAQPKPHSLKLQAAVLLCYALAAISGGLGESLWPSGIPFLPLIAVILVVGNASILHWYHPPT